MPHSFYGGATINIVHNSKLNNKSKDNKYSKQKDMASINQLVSEIAHALKQPNNKALRENLKLLIIHTRNELIRHGYERHGYVDKGLTQRFKVSLIDKPDGDPNFEDNKLDMLDLPTIKRSTNKIPKPVRLTNNLPFDRVSSIGWTTNREFPFIKETSARFRHQVPGLCGACYDYINGYIYIFPSNNKSFDLGHIVIEGAFENPTEIMIANNEVDAWDVTFDDNEFLLSEDMIGQIKEIIYKRDLVNNVRETNEIPEELKYNK